MTKKIFFLLAAACTMQAHAASALPIGRDSVRTEWLQYN